MNKKILAISVLGVLLVGSFIFFRSEKEISNESTPEDKKEELGADSKANNSDVSLSLNASIPAPSLERAMRPSGTVDVVTKKRVDEKIIQIVDVLKKDSKNTDVWMQLGLYAEVYTDYQYAREIYEYITKINPNSFTAYHNLGNLYRSYIKDYEKAESNMKVVLDLRPDDKAEYINLSDLYRYNLTAKSALADDILLTGIAKNPKSTDLMVYLASYYAETGDKVKAREYYEKALALSPPNSLLIKVELMKLSQ